MQMQMCLNICSKYADVSYYPNEYLAIVMTNQPDIARGECSVEELEGMMMKREYKHINTSKSIYLFIHYVMWIWICDVINMMALFTD